MLNKLVHNENIVWLVLVGVTILTWLLIEGRMSNTSVIAIILLSSLKVYFIGVSFMEVFKANNVFKVFYHVWVVIVLLIIAVFTLLNV